MVIGETGRHFPNVPTPVAEVHNTVCGIVPVQAQNMVVSGVMETIQKPWNVIYRLVQVIITSVV